MSSLKKQIEELSKRRGLEPELGEVPTCPECGKRADAILRCLIENTTVPEDDPKRWSPERPCSGCDELTKLGLRPGGPPPRVRICAVPQEWYAARDAGRPAGR